MTSYEPCVINSDGKCKRWSHDHGDPDHPFAACPRCTHQGGVNPVATQRETGVRYRDNGGAGRYAGSAPKGAAPAGAANTSCSGASPFKMGRTYRDGTP